MNLRISGSTAHVALPVLVVLLASCGSAPKRNSEAPASSTPAAANYAPKIGIAVRTSSRTCVQIANANLAPDSPITLVIPTAPQSFTQVQVKAPSASACPITKDLNANVSSYELNIQADAAVPKQVPMFAVVGTSAPFTIQDNNVVADLDQNGQHRTFRECSASDGVYLTVWSGSALASPLLWHGHYYEAGNPALGPACTPGEMAVSH